MASQLDITLIAKELVPDGTYPTVESEPPFAKSVRDASVLIRSNNPATYEILQRFVIRVFHRVHARIASKKITNFDFVYSSENALQLLRTISIAEEDPRMTEDVKDRYSRYSGAVQDIIATIAGAELVRVIPLDSSLKFKGNSDDRVEEAFETLDRILEVIAANASNSSSAKVEESIEKGQATVYIAYELDKANIPESAFDMPDPNSNPPTYLAPIQLTQVVNTTQKLTLQPDQRAFCHIYMTAQAYNADVDLITSRARGNDVGTSRGISLKIEKLIQIEATDTIDTIINKISTEINSETLNAIYSGSNISAQEDYVANILVAPEYNPFELKSAFTYKKILYPESTINEKRIATFDTYFRSNKLSFEARRYSTKVDTEMLIIGFYHRDNTDPLPVALSPNSNTYSRKVSQYIRESNLGIPGLIYGKGNDISEMRSSAPVSLFLNVDKGNVAAVSIDSNDGATATDPTALQDDKEGSLSNQIDTYYFHVDHLDNQGIPITPNQPVFPTTDDKLVFRISTSNYINEPSRLLTVDLSSIKYPSLNDDGTGVTINYLGEDIAGLVVDALYEEARVSNLDTGIQSTNILGAQVGDFDNYYSKIDVINETQVAIPTESTNDANELYDIDCGRVQIVAFRYREKEYKAIIDIISIPKKLWVATGNYQRRRTIWE